MTKRICTQCGAVLIEGARFCRQCGMKVDDAGTASVSALETRRLGEEDVLTNPVNVETTEALDPADAEPSPYDTQEAPKPVVAGESSPVPTTPDDTEPIQPKAQSIEREQTAPRQIKQSSGRRKGAMIAAALGVVILAAGSFFYINSRESSENQGENITIDSSLSSSPATRPSPGANEQPTPQPKQAELAEAANAEARPAETQNPQSAQARRETKSAPEASQEQKDGGGTGAAEYNLNQGITHLGAGRYQDALREFEYVKSLDPENKNVYYLIGQAYHKMGQLERALEAYRQCTSGVYASIAQNHVRMLEKRVGKTN